QIPEYELQNKGMTLAEFKVIYWWEWGHRQLGRFIGLVWALGFVGLLVTRRMPQRWASRFLLLGVLGGLQGLIGWWMVSSGLGGEALDVASYRLAIHLGLAFVILGILTSYILRLSRTRRELMQARRLREGRTRVMVTILLYLTFIQILIGALVAGIDAGRTYIDWPLMAGGFFPPDPLALDPIWRNFFEDEGLVQWMHRYWGYLVLLVGLFTWWQGRGSPYGRTRRVFDWMTVLLFGQVVVGIVTVMSAAPWNIAIIHQGLAVILWTGILYARFLTIYPVEGSVRDGTA
ncbi:MAG: COX15/CtaA family protein, partial [Pseudomonadota bacterium]